MKRSWMGRLPIVVALVLVAGFLVVGHVGRAPATASAAPACDPSAAMNHRLDELGRNGFVWQIGPPPPGLGGAVGYPRENVVTISPDMCLKMTSVVNHEWAHTQQARQYPDRAHQAYGGSDELEIAADCASLLLGSTVMPYLERREKATGQVGCTELELITAHRILAVPYSQT